MIKTLRRTLLYAGVVMFLAGIAGLLLGMTVPAIGVGVAGVVLMATLGDASGIPSASYIGTSLDFDGGSSE